MDNLARADIVFQIERLIQERVSNGHRYSLDAVSFVEWVRARRAGVSIYELRRHDEAAYREYLRAELERLGTAWRA